MNNHRPGPTRKTAAALRLCLLVAATVSGLALTACGGQSSSSTDTPSTAAGAGPLTEATAQDRIRQYLTETLNALPPGAALSAPPSEVDGKKPEVDLRNLPAAPCDGDLNNITGPKKAQVWYWLTGVPVTKTADYFNDIVRIWRDRLWNVTPIKAGEQSNAVTTDGYLLAVILGKASNTDSENGLALAGTSPCFPNTATGTTTPLPVTIEQR
ncbi:hypothetical protein ACFXHA_02065 [Nocardia sp. NPDC059240]|uniref:hypothetical protein n=1 Tax=Nocardia sp. NPDC059240 TaxID=3346786 RepID=UPI0036CF25A5